MNVLENLKQCREERLQLAKLHGGVWVSQLNELEEMIAVEEAKAVAVVEINVFFEEGYRWSVNIGNEESIDSNITKAEAMSIAKQLKKQYANAIINEQKLSRQERRDNIRSLHENGYSYDRSLRG